jgi:hypothetical protein
MRRDDIPRVGFRCQTGLHQPLLVGQRPLLNLPIRPSFRTQIGSDRIVYAVVAAVILDSALHFASQTPLSLTNSCLVSLDEIYSLPFVIQSGFG